MKTSTKIFIVYGAIVLVLQLVFLINSLIQNQRLKPLAIEMCKTLEKTPIHHIQIDASEIDYNPIISVTKYRTDRRTFYFGSYLSTSHISNDTLYIKDVKGYISMLPNPNLTDELRSMTIITKDEVIHTDY